MENIDNYIPVKACRHEIKDGVVTLYFRDPKPSIILKLFFKKLAEKEMKFDLDDIGAFIWNLCDGKNNISDIVVKTRNQFGDKVEPAENRVDLFIRQLRKGKFITLYTKK